MATNKTQATTLPLSHYIDAIEDPARKADCETLVKLMQKTTQQTAVLWGNGNPANISSHMVGFGQYHYKYASGTEGDSFCAGFANRKTDITIYISAGFEAVPELMAQLGKHKASKVCIYVKKLSDIVQDVLTKLIKRSVKLRSSRIGYPSHKLTVQFETVIAEIRNQTKQMFFFKI